MKTQTELENELRRLGLEVGDTLMVHSSMRAVGPIDGGADTMLEALLSVITPTGTLLMLLAADDEEPFDATTTPVDVEDYGILVERFRHRADVNDHPAARFGAKGSHAEYLLEPMPVDDYYGPGSVLERFVGLHGKVLRLGANIDTVTVTHYAEYLANVSPKRRVTRRYVRADVGEVFIESLDDSEGIQDWPNGDYFSQILIDYLITDAPRRGLVGRCVAELLDAKPFVEFAVEWLERNLTQR